MGWKGRVSGVGVALCVLLYAVPAVPAAEPTRAQYRDRAEAICSQGVKKAGPLLKHGLAAFKENKVRVAGPKLMGTAAAYEATRARLLDVPQPQSDASELSAWLRRLKIQNSLLKKAGEALSETQRVRAQGYLSRFVHNGNLANDLVLGFGFKSCRFNASFVRQ